MINNFRTGYHYLQFQVPRPGKY